METAIPSDSLRTAEEGGTVIGMVVRRLAGLLVLRLLPVGLLALSACSPAPTPGIATDRIDGVRIIVGTDSELISGPVALSVDATGLLYILDYDLSRVVVVRPDGQLVRTIGRPGSGPGELRRPSGLLVAGDSLRVADAGNLRLHTFSLASDSSRSTPLSAGANMGPVAISHDGGVVITTLGMGGALAVRYDPSGEEAVAMRIPPDPTSPVMNPPQAKRDLIAGRIPAIFRNVALPAFAPNGDVWLLLTGEGKVQRYSREGALRTAASIEMPEMKQVVDEAVAHARQTLDDARSLKSVRYFRDAATTAATLWILLNTTEDGPAVLVGVDSAAKVVRRLTWPDVRGARSFALDAGRRTIYFAVPGTASVVAASLPDSLPNE